MQRYFRDLSPNLEASFRVASKSSRHGVFEAMVLPCEGQQSRAFWPCQSELLRVQARVDQDRQATRANLAKEHDHGAWDCR